MSEQREVGVSTWGGERPKGEVRPLRRRAAAAAESEPKPRTVDVRDALSIALFLIGAVLVVLAVQHFGGWWAVTGLAGVAVVALATVLAWRPTE